MLGALLPALVAGAGFGGVAGAGMSGLRISPGLRHAAIGMAAGILLAVAFADLFPEGLQEAGMRAGAMWFLTGFAALFVLEVATRGHTHHAQGEEPVQERLRDAAREAFTQGLQLTAITSAVLVTGLAILVAVMLREVRAGSEDQAVTEPDEL